MEYIRSRTLIRYTECCLLLLTTAHAGATGAYVYIALFCEWQLQ